MRIATCKNRKQKQYHNQDVTWEAFIKKAQNTTRTSETVEEYKAMSKDQQADIKDVGGFVAGELKEGRRNNACVLSRSMITLDLDFADEDFLDDVTDLYGYRCCIYSTHKHTEKKPKYRWIIPLNREVTPDEYEAIARKQASFIGMDQFDDTTYQPARMMFWPSTSKDGEFVFRNIEGELLNADDELDDYPDWKDMSYWPRSSREAEITKKLAKKQEDPHSKTGWIGAFCRTYTIQEAIEKFIPEVYTPTKDDSRWTYSKGSTAGGLVIYEDKYAYSNHGTDPAGQMLCNSYDLVRTHLFGPEDKDQMLEFVSKDETTRDTMAAERRAEIEADFADELKDASQDDGRTADDNTGWINSLDYDKKGNLKQTTDNIVKILMNDPRIKDGLGGVDLFRSKAVKTGNLPWYKYNPQDTTWSDTDDAALRYFLEKHYEIVNKGKADDALAFVHDTNSFHPVRDYLKALVWDGVERVDHLFTDYLGTPESEYTKAVARKILAGAVARVFKPGCKMDYMPVLVGAQGLGKSHFLSVLGGAWFSDSITTISGKEGYEALHGSWIVEMAELTATRKSDIEAIKQFISKREDRYRKAYARRVSDNPRQCVFVGTTNDTEFLRDFTGNRRFWPITAGEGPKNKSIFDDLPGERDQIWAEAVYIYKEGEPLFLEGEAAIQAEEMQEEHTYRSVREDLIRDYLDRKLPADWDDLEIYQRQTWLEDPDNVGTVERKKVCMLEIWCELFSGNRSNFTNTDQRELRAIMERIGWKKSKNPLQYGKLYGRQKVYIKPESMWAKPKTIEKES